MNEGGIMKAVQTYFISLETEAIKILREVVFEATEIHIDTIRITIDAATEQVVNQVLGE
jgi:hypothetical protein